MGGFSLRSGRGSEHLPRKSEVDTRATADLCLAARRELEPLSGRRSLCSMVTAYETGLGTDGGIYSRKRR